MKLPFWPRRREEELNEEIQSHLRMAAHDRIERGETSDNAEKSACREFGNTSLIQDVTRDQWGWGWRWLEDLGQDVHYALRMLRKSPGFAAVAILTLAIGIGANTAVFSLLDALVLKYLPVHRSEELVQISRGEVDDFSNPLWEQLRDHQDVFAGVFAWSDQDFNLSEGSEQQRAHLAFVSGDCFSTLGVNVILGRPITRDDDRRGGGTDGPVTVINYSFWQSHYNADPQIIGKTIHIDHHPFLIVGVAPPHFSGMNIGSQTDVFIPVATDPILRSKSRLDRDAAWWLKVFARPKPGLTRPQIEARLNVLAPQLYNTALKSFPQQTIRFFLQQKMVLLPASSGMSGVRKNYSRALILMIALTGAVLLIACANIANLLLARATARQREIAMRRALGASRWRLVRQFLTESLLLSLLGGTLGILLAGWAAKVLILQFSTTELPLYLDLTPDKRVLGFEFGLIVLTALLFGLAPALRTGRVPAQQALKGGGAGFGSGSHRLGLGNWVVVGQVAAAVVLLVGTTLLVRTFRNLLTLDVGFDRDKVLLVNVDTVNGHLSQEEQRSFNSQLLEKLRSIPGVQSASQSEVTPLNALGYYDFVQISHGAGQREPIHTDFNVISSGYFATLGTPILAGRDFNSSDTQNSPKVVIINDSMARKLFPGQPPIGQSLRRLSGDMAGYEVIGVVKNTKIISLDEKEAFAFYVLADQEPTASAFMNYELRATSDPQNLIPSVREALGTSDSRISYELRALKLQVEESVSIQHAIAVLSSVFGGLALLLSLLGLYGVISYMTARRTNEIGIRMALGASPMHVLGMILADGARLAFIGSVLGVLAACWATRLVNKFLYGVGAHDPWIFTWVAFAVVAVAIVASYVPARRAMRVDPMAALRYE